MNEISRKLKVAIINAGGQTDYVFGLISGLVAQEIQIDLIDSNKSIRPAKSYPNFVTLHNFRGNQDSQRPALQKALEILKYYFRLLFYSIRSDSKVFHIQWLNYFYYFDRTLLMLFYRLLGKKIVFTAHNVNYSDDVKEAHGLRAFTNHITLGILYRLCHKLIVHNGYMKNELMRLFRIEGKKIVVIAHGVNDTIPMTSLTTRAARKRIGISDNKLRTILCFGRLVPYKGHDLLIDAVHMLKPSNYRLIIAGACDKHLDYLQTIREKIKSSGLCDQVTMRIGFVPEEEIETFFMAADCLVLPYRSIFQTGVSFLAYAFGLPQIVNDVGALRENVAEGKTGFVCPKVDANELAKTIELYFDSDIYKNLSSKRKEIRDYGFSKYSWEVSAKETFGIYHDLSRTI